MRTRALAGAALLLAILAPAAQAGEKARFTSSRSTEAKLSFTASVPGTGWDRKGREAAVLNVRVDGRWVADVVAFAGAERFRYETALGRVGRGRHTVSVTLDRGKSPVRHAGIGSLRPQLVDDLVARHAPILYGRDLPEIAGRYENARTDVPLLAYHATTSANGQTTIEYTAIWSNEDGGTNTPALMARWGRTTDIEWIYRVTLAADGTVVSAVYHGPNHETLPFTGLREDDHPLLQTATSNNNLLQVNDKRLTSGYRFFLDTRRTLPAGRAREAAMDAEPWTYQVMAREIVREGQVEPEPDPATPEVSDQRNYLFAEVDKDTRYGTPPASGSWIGTALEVRVGGQWYASHHGEPSWSIQRDDPAATTVELPPGTAAEDVEAVRAVAVPVGTPPADWRIDVTALNRGFFLGDDYLPSASFLTWRGAVALTPAQPEAVIWSPTSAFSSGVAFQYP
jgi:hypothetical protein